MKEQWIDVVGFEGLYKVSSLGKILDCSTLEIKIGSKRPDGYRSIRMKKGGKVYNRYVHRLVALHFISFVPSCKNNYQVNHKDQNKDNNTIYNLEFVSPKANANYGDRINRISETRKKNGSIGGVGKAVICQENGIIYHSIMEAERQTGVKNTLISKCCKGYQKTAGGFHWTYA